MKDKYSQAYLFNKTPRYIKNAKRENGLEGTLTARHLNLKLSPLSVGFLHSFCTPASGSPPTTGAWTFDLMRRNLRKAKAF